MSFLKSYDYSLLSEVFSADSGSSVISWQNIFSNNNELSVEIGCGNGHFIIEKSMSNLHENFIGIDTKRDRIVRCLEKQKKRNISNLRFIAGDAFFAISKMFSAGSISKVYMIFPDPWPKRKHRKKRLFKPDFVNILYEKMNAEGIFTFVTDFQDYFDEAFLIIKNDSRFLITLESLSEDYSFTLFGQKWEKEDKPFYGFTFTKL